MNKFFDKIMSIEFLAKWLLAWGIGANIIFIVVIVSKIIRIIGGL